MGTVRGTEHDQFVETMGGNLCCGEDDHPFVPATDRAGQSVSVQGI